MKLFIVVQMIVWALVQVPPDIPVIPSTNTEIAEGNVENLTELMNFDVYTKQAIFSPDGRWLAVARQEQDSDYTVNIYNISNTETVGYIQGFMNIFREMKWSADSQNLAIISGRLTGGGIELQAVNIYNVTASLDNQFYTFGNSDIAISNEIDISVATNNYPTPIEIAWHPFDPLLAISGVKSTCGQLRRQLSVNKTHARLRSGVCFFIQSLSQQHPIDNRRRQVHPARRLEVCASLGLP
jgi:WD40 repeat protein